MVTVVSAVECVHSAVVPDNNLLNIIIYTTIIIDIQNHKKLVSYMYYLFSVDYESIYHISITFYQMIDFSSQ